LTLMVLVLVVVWATFGVWWVRSHAQTSLGDSVGSFRRDLHVLERTAPATVRPANRLRVPSSQPVRGVPSAARSAAQGRVAPGRVTAGGVGAGRVGANRTSSPAQLRRRQSAKRRRDVLFVLVVAVLATLTMAAATRSHTVMAVQLLADATLAGYVALLVRMRNLASEREMKLTYMPTRQGPRRVTEAEAVYAGSYGSYADLALRRAAN
jgi:hypothetical protein